MTSQRVVWPRARLVSDSPVQQNILEYVLFHNSQNYDFSTFLIFISSTLWSTTLATANLLPQMLNTNTKTSTNTKTTEHQERSITKLLHNTRNNMATDHVRTILEDSTVSRVIYLRPIGAPSTMRFK